MGQKPDLELKKELKKGILTVAGCYVGWGVMVIYWKLLGDVDSYFVLASRIVWALVFCGITLVAQGKFGRVRDAFRNKGAIRLTMIAGFVIAVNWGSFIIAVQQGHVLQSSLGYYINPLITVLIGMLFFKERLNKMEWFSIGLAAVGVIYMMVAGRIVPTFALVIGGTFAIYGALKKKADLESQVSLFIETMTIFPFALLYVIFAEVTGNGAIGVLQGPWLLLIPFSGVITGLPLLFFGYGVRIIPYSMTGILMYINPTLQLLLGVFMFGEEFTGVHAVTFLFIWAAVIVFIYSKIRQTNQKQDK